MWKIIAIAALVALCLVAISFVATVIVGWRRYWLASRPIDKLGSFKLGDKLGQGGMGEVFHARHSMLQRPTVVKILRPQLSGERSVARFEREVQHTSQLHHPNTVAIYDYGKSKGGVFYYAMEYIDGVTLHDIVEQEGPLPEGRVISVLRQICGSLYEAHQRRLVHRDIKATNIMLSDRAGVPDFVKVLDFGLVRLMDPVGSQVTMEGSLTGTPLYMSPEAIEDPDHLDGRSDLYSVGVLGYYLLTGEYPFQGESAARICQHHLSDPPEPPSQRTDNPISPELEAIILKCLAKSPEDRPASAKELRKSLANCPAAASWTEEDARRWWDAQQTKTPADDPISPPVG